MTSLTILISALLCQNALSIQTISKNGCDQTKSCFFAPDGCDPATTCQYAVTYKLNGDTVAFELSTKMPTTGNSAGRYVALGFSKDNAMGNDAVTNCLLTPGSSQPTVRLAFNPSTSNRLIANDAAVKAQMISNEETGIVDGYLVCRFSQRVKAQGSTEVYDLDKPYYLLLARGSVQADGAVQIHGFDGDERPVKSTLLTVASGGGDPGPNAPATTPSTKATSGGSSPGSSPPNPTGANSTPSSLGATTRGGADSRFTTNFILIQGIVVILGLCYSRFYVVA